MPPRLKPWRITASVPAALKALVDQRVITEEYENYPEYLLALILADLAYPVQHRVMSDLLHRPRRIVDAVVDRIAAQPLSGIAPREIGGWLEWRVDELIREAQHGGGNGEHPP